MLNPIRSGGGSGKVLNGTFEGVLRNLEIVQGKKYKSEELEDKLRFVFEIESESTSVSMRCTPKLGDRARLTAILKQMAAPAEALRSAGKAWDYLMTQIGRTFFLSVSPNPEGTYTNIVSLMPKPGSVSPAPQPTTTDDDDIDF